jgi:hypothetical protein
LLLWKAETLTRLELISHLFYPILISFGLCAAVFLFGVLRSYASYQGKHLGGVLQLGGPAVVFALVIIGGKVIVPNAAPFSVAVYVHGTQGPQDVVLQNSGSVSLDLDERTTQQIGDKGQAVFPAVPPRFRDQEVQVYLQSDAFETAPPVQKIRLTPPIVYLPVRLRKGHIIVRVVDEKDRVVPGAEIHIDSEFLGNSDKEGNFKAEFTLRAAHETPTLHISAAGYEPGSWKISPLGVNEIQVQLKHQR